MAGLFTAAQAVQAHGRGGDTVLAHINPREAALLKARGGRGSRNPHTGLLEFFDDEEGFGDGNSTSGDDDIGGDGDDFARGTDAEISDFMNSIAADPNPGNVSEYTAWDGKGFDSFGDALSEGVGYGLGYGMNSLGKGISSTIQDMLDNPIRTIVNAGIGVAKFSNPVLAAGALANSVSGMFNGPTVGGYAQQAYNANKAPTAAAPEEGILAGSVGDTTLVGGGPGPSDPDYIGTTDQQRQTPEPQGNQGAEVSSGAAPPMTGLLTATSARTPNPNFVSPAERFKSDYYAPSPPLFRFDSAQGQLVRVN